MLTLLSYNLQSEMYKSFFPHNFDYIKVYSLVFYVYSQCVNPSPLSDTKIFPSLQKGNCITISRHTQFLPPPSPWQPLFYLMYLWVCLFETFHINGITQYVTFCVCFISFCVILSGFIHVVACISTSLLFVA